jgi:hypothetical protein
MTKTEAKPAIVAVNELFAKRPDGLREIVRAAMQEMLEGDDRHARRREGRAYGCPARLPLRPLFAHPDHPGRQARAARAAGSGRPLLDRAPSFHIRPSRTASFPATATRARFGPIVLTSLRLPFRRAKRFLTVVKKHIGGLIEIVPRHGVALLGNAHADIRFGRLISSLGQAQIPP